jgi:hypothetical protein
MLIYISDEWNFDDGSSTGSLILNDCDERGSRKYKKGKAKDKWIENCFIDS